MAASERQDEALEIRLVADATSVSAARHAVGDFAERWGIERSRVELAVSEAVANAVVHGYPGRPPGEVIVRASAFGSLLRVEVTDDGVGFRTKAESPGLGLGLRLIDSSTSQYTLGRSDAGGTLVSMRFEVRV
jgi:anti-sigma regulatory factor (Ser/Thr protein kinase)